MSSQIDLDKTWVLIIIFHSKLKGIITIIEKNSLSYIKVHLNRNKFSHSNLNLCSILSIE